MNHDIEVTPATPRGVRHCDGCGKELGVFDALWTVCMECTRARHRACVSGGKCTCGRKRVERTIVTRVRSWIACDRCLGTVRQLS
jgi:hypothetical protein